MSWNSQNNICWDLKTLTAVSGFDAISASRDIFNATHTALPIVRRTMVRPFEGGVESTEIDLLSEFFYSDNPDGAMIIPIIGDRGVGKSHIIRFLFENRPTDPKAHVVYIPKSGTDLRTTIGLIIEGLDERFDEIRESLATAQAHHPDPEELVQRLLVEVFLKVKKRADQPLPEDNAATTSLIKFAAALLDDSDFRKEFAQIGGPRRLLAGPLGEDIEIPDEKRTLFVLDDLPLGKLTVGQLAESARPAYNQFSTSHAARNKFLQFINEALPSALQEVFWSNGPKLTTLLKDVRRLLLEDDREIFLLIEDLVVLSGLQAELLQAFITPATEHPGDPKALAPLKVVFAMTNEPFRAIQETVVSRVKSVFAIALTQSENESEGEYFGQGARIAFLSKYLNAIRYSVKEISDFYTSNLGQQIPSKCDDCPVADKCLMDFGSHDGIGLYPFTRPALVNLLSSQSKNSFNPRGAIRGVLAEVLHDATKEIPNREFPSDQLMAAFKNENNAVPLEVMNEIKLKFTDDTARRINLQRFWAADKSVRDPWTEWIRDSFGLGEDDQRTSPDPEVINPKRADPPPPTLGENKFSYLDVWATGGNVIIPEQSARSLRTILYGLVSGQLEHRYGVSVSKPIFHVQSGDFLQRDSFIIAQAGGSGGVGENPKFWVTRIDTSISTALIFKHILQSSATGNLLSPSQLSDIYRFIEPMIQSAKAEYDSRYGDLSEDLEQLRFFASAFGESEEFLDNLLSDELKLDKNLQGRSAQWAVVITEWTELRAKTLEKVLAISGASKGDGGTISTRAQVLLNDRTPEETALSDAIQSMANEELLTDKRKLEMISSFLDGQDAKELFSKLRDSLSEIGLHLSGQLISQPLLLELSRRIERLDQNWNSGLLVQVHSGELTPQDVVKTVANTDPTFSDSVLRDLTEILVAVDGIISRAHQLGTGDSSSNATLFEIQSSISDIQQTLGQLK